MLSKFSKVLNPFAFIISVLAISLSLGYVVSAWSDPASDPPTGNVSSAISINVSSTTQWKEGALGIGSASAPFTLATGAISASSFFDRNDSAYFIDPSAEISSNFAGAIRFGDTAATCDVDSRGTMKYVAGGAGVADKTYYCIKTVSDSYSWVAVTNGVAVDGGVPFLASYSYRKAINIDNTANASALSDYQVKVTNPIYDETGLVGSWHFEENTGTTVADSSGSGNIGTMNGTSYWTASGKFGSGFSASGDDYVSVADSNSLDLTTIATITAWIKPDSLAANQMIVARNANSYSLGLYTTGKLTWGKNGVDEVQSSATLATGNWYYVAVTRSGGVDTIYINGVYDNSGTKADFVALADAVYIGKHPAAAGWNFNGSIDEVRIYSRALSAAEIQAQYEAKAKPNYGDVRFTKSDGSTLLDYWAEKDGTFWVEVAGTDTIPASSNYTIYAYYGNAGAASASNIADAFILGDDFNRADSSTVGNGWTVIGTNINSISGNRLRIDGTATAAPSIYKAYSANGDVILETSFKRTALSTLDFYAYLSDASYMYFWGMGGLYGNNNIYYVNGGWTNSGVPVVANQNYNLKIIIHSATHTADYDTGANIYSGTAGAAIGANPANSVMFGNWDTGSEFGYFDDVRVRKYTFPEPITYFGSEQVSGQSYSYRKALSIDNTAGSALTNYQVKVTDPIYNETGLVGSWHLDGGTSGSITNGTTAGFQDFSGNGNNGTFSNANNSVSPTTAWIAGKADGGVKFDGADDYVNVGSSSGLGRNLAMTVAAWIKPSSVGTYQIIMSGGNGWYLELRNSGRMFFSYTGAGEVNIMGNTVLTSGQWYYIVATAGNGFLNIYVNNTQDATPVSYSPSTFSPTIPVRIGSYTDGSEIFNGIIDEAKIYNRALSAAEIQAQYEAKAKPNYGDLRFTDSADWTESTWGISYPYWQEKDGTYWVRVPNIAASTNKTIYAYYGNAGAASASSEIATFGVDIVHIGTQIWMQNNLNVGTRIDGNVDATNNGIIEKYCYSDNEANCNTDGGIYQWNEMMAYSTVAGSQGIAPMGFHIPTDAEWYILENYLKDGANTCDSARTGWECDTAGTKLKVGGSSGFNVIFAGMHNTNYVFYYIGTYAFLWSSTESSASAWFRHFSSGSTVYRGTDPKATAYSVRAIKNSVATEPTVTTGAEE